MELLEMVPPEQRARVVKIAAPAAAGKSLTLLAALELKKILKEWLPPPDAFQVFRRLTNLPNTSTIHSLPIRSLWAAALDSAIHLEVIHEGGQSVNFPIPQIIGNADVSPIVGKTRNIFVACFADALAHSRSSALVLSGDLLLDVQGDELKSMPVELAFDPLVFDSDHVRAETIIDTATSNRMVVEEAWSLLGINTVSFGHWMVEALWQFLGARHLSALQGVPLLVDADIPKQHRETLEIFGRDRFPIIEVPRGTFVQARRLWIASNWTYMPHLLKTDRGLDASHFVFPESMFGKLWRAAGEELDRHSGFSAGSGKLFVTRSNQMHRKIVNSGEIIERLQRAGFSAWQPQEYSFLEQASRLRNSSQIVLQAGSAAQGLQLCRPGTSVAYLTHTSLPFIAVLGALLRALDIDFTLVVGPIVHETFPYRDMSDYQLPIGLLDRALVHISAHEYPAG